MINNTTTGQHDSSAILVLRGIVVDFEQDDSVYTSHRIMFMYGNNSACNTHSRLRHTGLDIIALAQVLSTKYENAGLNCYMWCHLTRELKLKRFPHFVRRVTLTMGKGRKNFYAVRVGRTTGIYSTWY